MPATTTQLSKTVETLRADGVDTAGVLVLDGPTGIAHIRVDVASGENDIVIVPQAIRPPEFPDGSVFISSAFS